jgi:hypothetical protein
MHQYDSAAAAEFLSGRYKAGREGVSGLGCPGRPHALPARSQSTGVHYKNYEFVRRVPAYQRAFWLTVATN